MNQLRRNRIVFLGVLLTFVAATASANAGAPLFYFFLSPLAIVVLAAVIAIEGFLAERIIGISRQRALGLSAIANVVSALIGLPLSWFVYVPNATYQQAAFFTAILLVPAFFISVFSEMLIAMLFVTAEKRSAVRKWSWRANSYTYEGMLVLLLAVALFDRLR